MEPLTITPRQRQTTFDEPALAHRTPDEQPNDPQESLIVEIFRYAILALVIVLPFRLFVAQPFIVNGASMSPTFETGQYLIVDQVSYRFEPPVRGDVVIFKYPHNTEQYFIKRIIGLPGETVVVKNTTVTVRNTVSGTEMVLTEPYLPSGTEDLGQVTITLSPDEYFVMGDNRDQSSDSRSWGPVAKRYIVGRALVRLLPASLLDFLPGEYHFDDPANVK